MSLKYRDRPVAEFHDLFHIGRNQQNGHAFIPEVMNDTVDITAGSPSMPRVGSSRMTSFGFVESARLRTTFC